MKRSSSASLLSPERDAPPRPNPVLAPLSRGYPGPGGTFSMSYAPFRRFTRRVAPPFSLDLHVLSTPPTFVLSQDQTLHANFHSSEGFSTSSATLFTPLEVRTSNGACMLLSDLVKTRFYGVQLRPPLNEVLLCLPSTFCLKKILRHRYISKNYY